MIEETPFKYELTEIATKGKLSQANFIQTRIELAKGVIETINTLGMNRYRDYIEEFTQNLIITVTTTLGQYEEIIFSDLSAIKVTVTIYEFNLKEPFSWAKLKNPKEFTYKAKILDVDSTQKSQQNTMINNDKVGHLTLKEFSIQLLEPCFESVSIKTVGGVFRKTNGVELMKTLLTKYSTEDDNDPITAVKGVDVVDEFNEAIREQIIIPHMTPLVKAITLINENCGGVYPTGFSFFLQNQLWYLFPPYDLTQFNKTNRSITVVNIPKDRIPGIEKTYHNTDTKLIVLSTRDAKIIDRREVNTFNKGSAIRFVEANKLFEDFGAVEDNKYIVDVSLNVNEMAIEERTDQANILRSTDIKITSNKNHELSKLAKVQGFYFQLTWEHSDDSLLHPGMPAKILFLKDNKPASVTGVLIENETIWLPMEQNFENVKLQKVSSLTFFVGNEQFIED